MSLMAIRSKVKGLNEEVKSLEKTMATIKSDLAHLDSMIARIQGEGETKAKASKSKVWSVDSSKVPKTQMRRPKGMVSPFTDEPAAPEAGGEVHVAGEEKYGD